MNRLVEHPRLALCLIALCIFSTWGLIFAVAHIDATARGDLEIRNCKANNELRQIINRGTDPDVPSLPCR